MPVFVISDLSIGIFLSLLQSNVHVAIKAGQNLGACVIIGETQLNFTCWMCNQQRQYLVYPSVVHSRVQLHNHWAPNDLHFHLLN